MSSELERRAEQYLTLAERLRLRRSSKALVLDVSGSMASDIEPGKRKIDALREMIAGATTNAVYWFNNGFGVCDKDSIPDAHGGTKLSPVLNHMQSLGIKSALILTDGDIQDKDATLLAAKNMTIQVMYIGAGQRPEFLDKLANASGGYATTEDLKQTKQLTEKVTLLLTSGKDAPRKGAIEL